MFQVISIHEVKPLLPNCVRPSFRTISRVRVCLYVCLYIQKPIQLICNSCWKWRRVCYSWYRLPSWIMLVYFENS